MRKIIIPLSGGIDSTYLAAHALHTGHHVFPVEFDDGNMTGNSEVEAARQVHRHFATDVYLAKIEPLQSLRIPMLTQLEVQYEIKPAAASQSDAMREIKYWSGYKALMYATTLAYGGAIGADEIQFGVMEWNDHFTDELPESARLFRDTWTLLYPDLKVPVFTFPLMGMKKRGVIRSSALIGSPLHLTWSCFNDELEHHCGECLGCTERKTGFKSAGIIDPTRYQSCS